MNGNIIFTCKLFVSEVVWSCHFKHCLYPSRFSDKEEINEIHTLKLIEEMPERSLIIFWNELIITFCLQLFIIARFKNPNTSITTNRHSQG
jgi:hypothetical protein